MGDFESNFLNLPINPNFPQRLLFKRNKFITNFPSELQEKSLLTEHFPVTSSCSQAEGEAISTKNVRSEDSASNLYNGGGKSLPPPRPISLALKGQSRASLDNSKSFASNMTKPLELINLLK